jgi:hypothetical protein
MSMLPKELFRIKEQLHISSQLTNVQKTLLDELSALDKDQVIAERLKKSKREIISDPIPSQRVVGPSDHCRCCGQKLPG